MNKKFEAFLVSVYFTLMMMVFCIANVLALDFSMVPPSASQIPSNGSAAEASRWIITFIFTGLFCYFMHLIGRKNYREDAPLKVTPRSKNQ